MLGLGFLAFTVIGLLATYGIAELMISYKIYPHFGNRAPAMRKD